jgi:hypothetical protein
MPYLIIVDVVMPRKSGYEAAAPAMAPSQLTSQTKPLCDEILRLNESQRSLQTALESGRSQSVRLTSHYSELESHYARLMGFYVATQRLLDAESRENLFEIIHEIIATRIGCDEFGVFRVDEQCTPLPTAADESRRPNVYLHPDHDYFGLSTRPRFGGFLGGNE